MIFCHAAGFAGSSVGSLGWVSLDLGMAGLTCFFVLSGFLLYRPYASAHAGLRRAPSLRAYARRRALRILPAYWAALTLLAIWPGIIGPFSGRWWLYYGFGQGFSMNTIGHGIPVGWSICTEVSFYLLLPALAGLAASLARPARVRSARSARSGSWWRAELAVILPFAIVPVLVRPFVQDGELPKWVANTLLCTSDWFAFGMLLAVLSVAAERRRRLPARAAALVGPAWPWWTGALVLLLLAHFGFDVWQVGVAHPRPMTFETLVNHELIGSAALLILVPVVFGSGGAIRRVLGMRGPAFAGMVSYGMYLWHAPLLAWLSGDPTSRVITDTGPGIQQLVGGSPTLVLWVCGTALSVIAGIGSYYLVELPFLRLKERRLAVAWGRGGMGEPSHAESAR